jgi:hypothetical protein
VVPEFARHVGALRASGSQGRAIDAVKMLGDVVAGLGEEPDSDLLATMLEAVSSASSAGALNHLDAELFALPPDADEGTIADLAERTGVELKAFYDSYMTTHTPEDWASAAPIDQILSGLSEASLNAAQREVVRRSTAILEAHAAA